MSLKGIKSGLFEPKLVPSIVPMPFCAKRDTMAVGMTMIASIGNLVHELAEAVPFLNSMFTTCRFRKQVPKGVLWQVCERRPSFSLAQGISLKRNCGAPLRRQMLNYLGEGINTGFRVGIFGPWQRGESRKIVANAKLPRRRFEVDAEGWRAYGSCAELELISEIPLKTQN